MKWDARTIGAHLATVTFDRKHLVIVPNCSWPGNECDVLVVTPNLRIIDVEIKISRSDLKADVQKSKWFHHWDWKIDGPMRDHREGTPRRARDWPERVWKHYYAMPREIWKDELAAILPPVSGILLFSECDDGKIRPICHRHAQPNRKADRLSAEDAIDIARLASLRMWAAYKELDQLRDITAKRDARA